MHHSRINSLAAVAAVGAAVWAVGCGRDDTARVQEGPEPGLERPVPGPRVPEGRPAPARPTGQAVSMAFPTGDRESSVLLLETNRPERVRVGEEFAYRIKLTNLTENLVLENVRIHHEGGDVLDVDRFAVEGERDEGRKAEGEKKAEAGRQTLKTPGIRLMPRESKVLVARASAAKVGDAAACLRVSYEPALCLTTAVVKPEIELIKAAPEVSDLCTGLVFRYTVRNTGNAVARDVRIIEELPEGLMIGENARAVELRVGDLEPGASRELTAQIVPARPGAYSSRAVAVSENLRVRSAETTTAVRRSKLALTIDAPPDLYVGTPATVRFRVTNEGDFAAENARLAISFANRNLRIVRLGEVVDADEDIVDREVGQEPIIRNLGNIAPGATKEIPMVVRPVGTEPLEIIGTASSECARAADIEAAVVKQTVRMQVTTLPALLLAFFDNTDPVRVGDITTYTLRVTNQGTGPDQKVQVVVTLPQGMEYVDASGPVQARAEGNKLTFGPIDSVAPGQNLTWSIRARATNPGDVQAKAELTSQYLGQPATAEEPTRLIR